MTIENTGGVITPMIPLQYVTQPQPYYNYAMGTEITEEKLYDMIEKVLNKFELATKEKVVVEDNEENITKLRHFNISVSDVKPLNSTLSMCKVSLYYEGQNRNSVYIDHDVAQALNETIGGIPIVGVFSNETEDFGDH